MEVFRSLAALARRTADEPVRCVATIGAYDGLHVGHQEILSRVRERARGSGALALVFAFDPTPREFLAADDPPPRLTRFRERVELLKSLGMDRFFCPRFDRRIMCLSVGEFIERLLIGGVRPACLVVGEEFRFARRRQGGVAELREAGERLGFEVESVASVSLGGVRVSSTAIREALARGDLAAARRMLGRPYSMTGRVLHGRRLGRSLGFPTANLGLGRRVSPLSGIFAVRVHGLAPEPLDAVASVGTRPTVEGDGRPLLEVHLFDFKRDIYGALMTVEFVQRLRDEERFESVEAMTAQMHRDCEQARAALAG